MFEVATPVLGVEGTLDAADGFLGYVLVFVLAMVPGIEPFIVIPAAVAIGLDPLLTGVAAFAGSLTVMGAIVLAHARLRAWWRRRRGGDDSGSSKRAGRARRLWNRYGLPGLAVVGPILAGIHLTALFAAVSGADRRSVLGWLTVGAGVWTVGLVVGAVAGLSLLGLT